MASATDTDKDAVEAVLFVEAAKRRPLLAPTELLLKP
jgi:hypothetical protein